MKFKVREKIFSFRDDFTIKDENDNDYFQVTGKIFTIGNKLHFKDMSGNELLYIEQQLLKFLAEYNIYSKGKVVGKVKKKLTFFRSGFDIISTYGNYEVDGDFFGYNFVIRKNGSVIATVSKKFFSFTDHYGVEIADNEEYIFILALVIVIDQVIHDNSGSNK
ncbi:uncharacterized protein YxjI [Natranaerovirga pectinivora]|uniref:Uncharacterized protein YxjI n=1 Tax=Natranaerovirga pectinivora TaxID=682400 RepID=A0A4R3MKZ0_9FIRM|nr:LURP-one-related family protein [Natranaerovirga pectinivora]TCT14383.1 uncharacterized protein YxjI [Natranaerovirga pectinivora]